MAVDEKVLEADRRRLHELGYAQELRRGLKTFSNFAISFSIISVLAGALTTYYLGMQAGGPLVITTGWIIVGALSTLVAMAMAEICSAYPTAGGLYYWSAKLARKNPARWSWFTGWINLIGLVGVVASVDYALATFTGWFINYYDSSWLWFDNTLSARSIYLIYAIILALHGILNVFGVRLVRFLSDVSVWWHVIGVAIIIIALLTIPSNVEGFDFIFTRKNLTGWDGGSTTGLPFFLYVFPIGLLLAQYTLTGYDASAHVSEETQGAAEGAAKAMVRSVYISVIVAWILNVVMTASIPKAAGKYDEIAFVGINSSPALFDAAVGGNTARLMVFIAVVGQFFCGMCGVTSASRMIYGFSRDGGIPGSRMWHQVNPKTRTPTNSVWLICGIAAVVGALSLVQNKNYSIAFFALVGITAIGLYVAYVIPVFLRLRDPEFRPGPWNLGRYSKLVGCISLVWVAVICILFVLPVYGPTEVFWPPWHSDTINNFNFTGPIMIVAVGLVALWWAVSAKKWFKGPKVQGSEEELRGIEAELAALERGEAIPTES